MQLIVVKQGIFSLCVAQKKSNFCKRDIFICINYQTFTFELKNTTLHLEPLNLECNFGTCPKVWTFDMREIKSVLSEVYAGFVS